MAYRFKPSEKISKGFRRIAVEQLERAEVSLTGNPDHERAIHDTRRCIKRVRALLRLVRPGLRSKVFKDENAALREIAALLSETRDNHVLLDTIASLSAANPKAPLAGLRRLAEEQAGHHLNIDDPGRTAAVVAGLRAARARIKHIQIKPSRFATLRSGIERTLQGGRRAIGAAYRSNDCEAFHDVRKYVQQLWRHSQLLNEAWPDLMDAQAAAARDLSQILGDDHDLAMLSSFLDRAPHGTIKGDEEPQIRQAIRERQLEFRELARPKLARLFAEKPRDMGRRIEGWWKSSQRIKKSRNPPAVSPPDMDTAASTQEPAQLPPALLPAPEQPTGRAA